MEISEKPAPLLAVGKCRGPQSLQIAPLAAKHKVDIAAADQHRDLLVQRASDLYVRQLNLAEKEALAKSNVDGAAAIGKERDSVKAG